MPTTKYDTNKESGQQVRPTSSGQSARIKYSKRTELIMHELGSARWAQARVGQTRPYHTLAPALPLPLPYPCLCLARALPRSCIINSLDPTCPDGAAGPGPSPGCARRVYIDMCSSEILIVLHV